MKWETRIFTCYCSVFDSLRSESKLATTAVPLIATWDCEQSLAPGGHSICMFVGMNCEDTKEMRLLITVTSIVSFYFGKYKE